MELRSSRESVREGVLFNQARNILQGIFNFARTELEAHEEAEDDSAQAAKRLADSPASLTRFPLLGMVELALNGKCNPRYTTYPLNLTKPERTQLIEAMFRDQAQKPEGFVRQVQLVELSQDQGIAVLDILTGILQINVLHPFVAYFLDEYEDKNRGLPLKLLATSEVLMEAHLYAVGLEEAAINDTMGRRDWLLRYLARSSGKTTARLIAQALEDASTDKNQLEMELVRAFDSMGFDAIPLGGSGKPDGKAEAIFQGERGKIERYAVSLEAKSKGKTGTTVRNEDVHVSTVARHRNDHGCDHALVLGPNFATMKGDMSALVKEIQADREKTGKTITLLRIIDLARLVRLVPLKRINLGQLRTFFEAGPHPRKQKSGSTKSPPRRKSAHGSKRSLKQLPRSKRSNRAQRSNMRQLWGDCVGAAALRWRNRK